MQNYLTWLGRTRVRWSKRILACKKPRMLVFEPQLQGDTARSLHWQA
jgi:hypothetical protein